MELQLFDPLPQQQCIEDSDWLEVYPSQNLNTGGPIYLDIPAQETCWLDTFHSFLQVNLRIFIEGGQKLRTSRPQGANADLVDEHEMVAPASVFLHALFSRISIMINGTECGQTTPDSNPLLNFLAIHFNYTPPTGSGGFNDGLLAWDQRAWVDWVQSSVDTVGKESNWRQNGILYQDTYRIQGSRPVDLYGKLSLGWFSQGRLLPSGIKVRLGLERSRPEACLISGEATNRKYEIRMEECVLIIRRVELSPTTGAYLNGQLSHRPALYPFTQLELRNFIISSGKTSHQARNLWTGRLPSRVFFMLRPINATRLFRADPFRFNHHNVNYVDFLLNEKSVLARPYRPDYGTSKETANYTETYMGLYQALRLAGKDQVRGIYYENFARGMCIYGADLSPDLSSHSPLKRGNFSVDVRFVPEKAPDEELEGLVVGEFYNTLMLEGNGKTVLNDN